MSIMKKELFLCLLLLTALVLPAIAKDRVVPPDGLQEEEYVMTFDNYRYIFWNDKPEYHNLTRDMTIARNNDELYIKGIFRDFPDCWIKGTVMDSRYLVIEDSQYLTTQGTDSIFFRCGVTEYRYNEGNTF